MPLSVNSNNRGVSSAPVCKHSTVVTVVVAVVAVAADAAGRRRRHESYRFQKVGEMNSVLETGVTKFFHSGSDFWARKPCRFLS